MRITHGTRRRKPDSELRRLTSVSWSLSSAICVLLPLPSANCQLPTPSGSWSLVFWSHLSPLPRAYNNTQKNILDVMIAQSVESSGGPDNVTVAQLIGIKEMLENEFTLAAALSDDKNAEEIGGL